MDIHKPYKNSKLESRRQSLIATAQADAALRRSKSNNGKISVAVQRALAGDQSTTLGQLIASAQAKLAAANHSAFESLLTAMAEKSSLLEGDARRFVAAIFALASQRRQWIREPAAWKVGTHNESRQFSSLLRHLLAKYKVPAFFDVAWLDPSELTGQNWFIHVAQGGNLRKAAKLPIALTKMMAHHVMLASDSCTITQAIRYGQARGLGVSERHTRAVLGSMLGSRFHSPAREEFWETFLRWLVQNPMVDPAQVGPIVDYIVNQKFARQDQIVVNGELVRPGPPQAGLSMKGRSADALVRQVEAWHRQLNRTSIARDCAWKSCGIAGYERVEGQGNNVRAFIITELLNSALLRTEGAAMRHCVGTYARSCASGRVAIYSLHVATALGRERMVTIEVDVLNRQIVQARKRMNEPTTPLDQRVMNGWAAIAGLSFGKYALTRRY